MIEVKNLVKDYGGRLAAKLQKIPKKEQKIEIRDMIPNLGKKHTAILTLIVIAAIIKYTYEKDGESETMILNIGSLNDDGTAYYTKQEESAAVNLINREQVEKCLKVNAGD